MKKFNEFYLESKKKKSIADIIKDLLKQNISDKEIVKNLQLIQIRNGYPKSSDKDWLTLINKMKRDKL